MSIGAGGGGLGTQQIFILGGSAPRSKPLSFYIPFVVKKVPLSYTFCSQMAKWHPFHLPHLELCIPFNCCKCFVI